LNLVTDSEGYSRSVLSGKKIKGVDYALVDRLIFESMHGPLLGRIMLLKARLKERLKAMRREKR
jgi:hypothetical protein